ncbi:hypothetical protein [Mycoplasmopsis glycophila]|nr:hypothetical protein [Mycoplasmopsis glycophila]
MIMMQADLLKRKMVKSLVLWLIVYPILICIPFGLIAGLYGKQIVQVGIENYDYKNINIALLAFCGFYLFIIGIASFVTFISTIVKCFSYTGNIQTFLLSSGYFGLYNFGICRTFFIIGIFFPIFYLIAMIMTISRASALKRNLALAMSTQQNQWN